MEPIDRRLIRLYVAAQGLAIVSHQLVSDRVGLLNASSHTFCTDNSYAEPDGFELHS